VSKLSVVCTDFKPMRRNTLIGFANIRIAEMMLTIRDVALHEKNGARWAQPPSKPQVSKDGKVITKDGKVQYSTILAAQPRSRRCSISRPARSTMGAPHDAARSCARSHPPRL
jgi:hypothetical protein